MGAIRRPWHVKLFVGLLGADPDLLRRARQLLSKRWGAIDAESELLPFAYTDYYAAEMGADLKRLFVAFETPVSPERLVEAKLECNDLEARIAEESLAHVPRPVNLDPGYVDLGKLVLASTKDNAHRLYLGHGIYGECTLQFIDGRWREHPWTYADYRTAHYHEYFSRLRELLKAHREDSVAQHQPRRIGPE